MKHISSTMLTMSILSATAMADNSVEAASDSVFTSIAHSLSSNIVLVVSHLLNDSSDSNNTIQGCHNRVLYVIVGAHSHVNHRPHTFRVMKTLG